MEKNCKSCGQTLPISEFYRHPKMRDGHLNICKDCQKLVTRRARSANAEHYRAYDIKRAKSPARKARVVENTRRRRREAAGYMAAHNVVSRALNTGKLERQPCQMCGTCEWVHAHHDDYAKPLEVMWLCPIHHKARHAYLEWLKA